MGLLAWLLSPVLVLLNLEVDADGMEQIDGVYSADAHRWRPGDGQQ
jgi:hypothetical protein